MLDNRKPLPKEYSLWLNGTEYRIEYEIGRGASCIVYYGCYYDAIGEKHLVRIKECYPYHCEIRRLNDGSLGIPKGYEKQYKEAQKKFRFSYSRNVKIRNTLGLVNSTVDASHLFECNQTLYIVTGAIEGCDYRNNIDTDLQSVWIRVLSLAKVIKKYHDLGFLHLDIKPENILIIPETKEHIFLFDFDSLVPIDEVCNDTIQFSCSDGYAPLELVRGDRNKIHVTADIYSIGAVVFYKLFGRTPNAMDGSISRNYDFSKLVFSDPRYQMKTDLLRKIRLFLHKTIASSTVCRYQSMDLVITELEELVRLSDIKTAVLYDSFEYSTACFVGRDAEMNSISSLLEENHVLFLSGIGGIGKTELAKRYAYENREQYNNIVFLSFQKSIMETVCGPELFIGSFEKEKDETVEGYFERKLNMVKHLARPDDLIILDNFDVPADDHLESFLECSCRFLITTREEGFRDYNFNQLDIGCMNEMEDLLAIFRNYNSKEYTENQLQSICEIIQWIDRHTMTVDLISKYLRDTGEDPACLLKKLKDREGIINTGETEVRLRKDRKMKQESVSGHLTTLFDLSGFSESECELLRSLSLLGYVRIDRKTFLKLCDRSEQDRELEHLIQRGWIEYQQSKDKISFHQIILDLVFCYLAPVSENCTHLTHSMYDYMEQKCVNSVEREIRNRLCEGFMERLQGNDFSYAKLCVLYRERIGSNNQKLEEAEQICLRFRNRESYQLLQRIYRKKLFILSLGDDIFNEFFENEDVDIDAIFDQNSVKMCEFAQKAYEAAKNYSTDPAYLGQFCIKLAEDLDNAAVENLFMASLNGDENNEPMNRMLDLAVKLLDEGGTYIQDSQIEKKEKKDLFCKIRDFFGKVDFTKIYRCERYADSEKAHKYQQMIDSLRDPDMIYVDYGIDYDNLVEQAEKRGDYEKAIVLCRKACEEYGFFDYLNRRIPDIYLKMGETQKAIDLLKKEMEEGEGEDQITSCIKLTDILIGEERKEEAKTCLKKLIQYGMEQYEQNDSCENAACIIAGAYRLYELEEDQTKQAGYWNLCQKYFSKTSQEEAYPKELRGFLTAMIDKEEDSMKKIMLAFRFAKQTYVWSAVEEKIYFYRLAAAIEGEGAEFAEYQIQALLKWGEYILDSYSDNYDQVYENCQQAETQYVKWGVKNEYLRNRIHKIRSEYYANSNHYNTDDMREEQKKCNYYFIAEYEGKGEDIQKQITLWKDAAGEYDILKNTDMELKCVNRGLEIASAAVRENDLYFADYEFLRKSQMKCYIIKKDQKALKESAFLFYEEMVRHYERSKENTYGSSPMQDFKWKLRQIAKYFQEGGMERESLLVDLLSVLIILGGKRDQTITLQIRDFIEKSPEDLLEPIKDMLHEEMENDSIEGVIELYNEMLPRFHHCQDFADIANELHWFSDTYQYSLIEFKK